MFPGNAVPAILIMLRSDPRDAESRPRSALFLNSPRRTPPSG